SPASSVSSPEQIAALQAEVERLRSIMPGQAVAMTQVAYNFSNLWFAVQEKNWALAQFYLNETRVRLRWALRITPTRKIGAGELSLQPILDELEQIHLAPLRAIVDAQTTEGFAAAYDDVLGACYGCHVASEKPYLRLTRPSQPAETLIAFGGG
ncbi:MAG TPA: hypothetical protein VLD39_07010, partial [Gammaproteobacteria bacterium]|nr:hypothetical protein [Gammaproteobacteria bacterium]